MLFVVFYRVVWTVKMGMDTKYTGVPVDTSAALEVQGSIPIATAFDNQHSTTAQLASAKVDKGLHDVCH